MKTLLIAAAALALTLGAASAQTTQGTGVTKNDAQRSMERNNNIVTPGTSSGGTIGMSNQAPAKAQPGGHAGSGGPNAGNEGGAAPGANAGGGNGGSGSR